ncbi:cytochrome P450 [Paraphoma chrysanthemicola]|uniref:Cytochrome P450 n=1 Tax=Paraphoma chrysanthemicola TaxID=798071 RepID=A0A8K0VVZ6_9PLEO|nr:cytochrome P450 [Paraphoma chrysanthemicola]
MAFIPIFVTLCSLFVLREAFKWLRMIAKARSIGLPLVFVPIDQTNFLWIFFASRHRFRLRRLLPSWLWHRISITIPGWELFEPSNPHQRNLAGRVDSRETSFTLVGPRSYEFWTADPQLSNEILRRIHDFEQPRELEFLLAKFGPNVLTANGDQWSRHRKIVAKVINERISKAVFEKSIYYSQTLLHDLLPTSPAKNSSIETTMLFDRLTEISFSILIGVGIGDKFPWYNEENQEPQPPYQMAYKDALLTYVNNAFGLAILPPRILNHWPSWAPGHAKMRKVGRSMTEFCMRNQSLIDQEQVRIAAGETGESSPPDFLTLLVQASQGGNGDKRTTLSQNEMISNLFAFTAGGYKTIAGALDFAVVLLARFPVWQDWLIEEIDTLIPDAEDAAENLEYTTIFPAAIRTLAFVLETERLYGSASRLFRVSSGPQTLQTSSGTTIRLPAKTRVHINVVALHHSSSWKDTNHESDPAHYKPITSIPDEARFRPSRWINTAGSPTLHFHPPRGTFVPWSQGPRICPGQKMAQVEITTLILCLLRRHRIEPMRVQGETLREVERRLDAELRDLQWAGIVSLEKGPGLGFSTSQRR